MSLDIQALTKAIDGAQESLVGLDREVCEKTIWSSPAGKKRLAKRLVSMFPPHKTYVEPFAGSGAVLFEKQPADVEAINDADQEIVRAYRIIQRLTKEKIARLGRMNWTGDEATFKRIYNSTPNGDLSKLYKFLYVTHFSYGRMRGGSFSPSAQGVPARTVSRIEQFAPRLKNVKVHGGDYERVISQYDSPNTLFYLDPPYAGYDASVGEGQFEEERFFNVLKSIKGKFLLTYGIRGKLPGLLKKSRFHIKRVRTERSIRSMRGAKGPSVLTQLVVTNYAHEKIEPAKPADEDKKPEATIDKNDFIKEVPLIKNLDPSDERYVLGIVLEPETVDSQGDIYSAEEIRQAAHKFMEEFGGLGLQHRFRINDQAKILETYLAPTEMTIGKAKVRKGTWLLAVRVLSDELWNQIKDGNFTGFSIGGSARRAPENKPRNSETA